MKRGWYIGSPEFRKRLSDPLSQLAKKGDNYRDRQRREHGEDEAERLLAAGLRVLGLRENEVLEMLNNRKEKQALAWLVNAHTTVTVRWTAARLEMGHPENASDLLPLMGDPFTLIRVHERRSVLSSLYSQSVR